MNKKVIFPIAVAALLGVACTPENKGNNATDNTPAEGKAPAGAVDLGIVMTREDGTTYHLYWATCNLCEDGFVSSPEQYGDYYAWGELEPYYAKGHSQDSPCNDWRVIDGKKMTGYDLSSYKWCKGDFTKITRYCLADEAEYWAGTGAPDGKAEFKDYDYADDAARQTLGGKWRIPTDAEWGELLDKCTCTWTTLHGVNGCLIKAPNGKSIFLPAAGYRGGSDIKYKDTDGTYWSSSRFLYGSENAGRSCTMSFYSGHVGHLFRGRICGESIRPVSE